MLLNYAYLTKSVALVVDPPHPSQPEMATFTEEQSRLFLEAAATRFDEALSNRYNKREKEGAVNHY